VNVARVRRLIVVTLIAIFAVSLITLLSGGLTPNANPTRQRPIDPTQLPPTPGENTQPTGEPGLGGLGTGESAWIQRADPETGQLTQEFFYESLTPHEEGIFDITGPQARIYLAPWRVIHMKSDEGRFIAPDNHPMRGEFRENLVVTVFQCEPGEAIDLSADSPHRLLEFHIEQSATFDTVQGEIQADGPVELVTPVTQQVNFQGTGMRLVYNELNRRIEYMEITEGKQLTYNPGTDAAAEESDDETGEEESESSDDEQEDELLQYYRVTFDQDVKVNSGPRTIGADHLVVFFTMERTGTQTEPQELPETAPPPPGLGDASSTSPASTLTARLMRYALTSMVGQVGDKPIINVPPSQQPEPAMDPLASNDPVVLTWAGKMVMVPVEIKPQRMADGEDIYLRFEGEPITAELGDNQSLTCRSLDFLQSTQRIGIEGSQAYPLRIASPEMGTLGAPSMQVELAKGTGKIDGPGWIRAPENPDNPDAAADTTPTALPPGFRIEWADRVDLAFAGQGGRTQLQRATFIGDITAVDDQFDLTADQLATEFSTGGDQSGQQLRAIDALGNVHIEVADGTIDAEALRVMTEPDASGELAPARVQARGNVLVVDPEQRIAAQVLDVTLARADTLEPAASKSGDNPEAQRAMQDRFARKIQQVTAQEDVRLMLSGGTIVRGDKLVADATTQKATLFGSPVKITRGGQDADTRPQTELHVLHLNIEKNGRIAYADGAGKFVYTEPDVIHAKTEQRTPGQRVNVTWTKEMRFVDKSNTIHVVGDVAAEAEEAADQVNKLTAGRVTLEMINTPDAIITGDDDDSEQPSELDRRRLQYMTAREDVVVLATRWTDSSRKKVATRFRLAGPSLQFEDLRKLVTVTGAGTMLIEDYRPEDDDASRSDLTAAPVSGRGVTAFQWSEKLTINESAKDMTIEGRVLMRHRPPDSETVLELQCQKLEADMESLADVKPTEMPVGKMTIDHIEATGGVMVRDGNRVVSCDHLYYDGKQETVILSAGSDRWVNITHLDKPKPLRAKRIKWHLKDDRLEIIEAGR